MNREKIINAILLEYCHLAPDGGAYKIDLDLLFKSIENLGYQHYFSAARLSESVDAIDKMVPHLPEASVKKEKATKRLTDDDIDLFRSIMGPKLRHDFSDEDLKNLDLSLPVNTPPDVFPSAEDFPSGLSYDEMVKRLKEAGPFRLTQSASRLRLYDKQGFCLSLVNIPGKLKLGTYYFRAMLLFLRLFKEHANDIKVADAVDSEKSTKESAESLAKYFRENNPNKVAFKLYIHDGADHVPTNIKADDAHYIASGGTRKADMAMSENGRDTFWISFKSADFYKQKMGGPLARVGIRHYGMITALNDVLSTNPTWIELRRKLIAGLIKYIPRIQIDAKTTKIDPTTGYVSILNGKPVAEVVTGDNLTKLQHFSKAVERLLTNDKAKKKYVYFCKSFGDGGMMDLLDGTDATKEIAGMAIYGLDFKLKGGTFGPENCNVLMQSKTPLTIEQHIGDVSEPSLIVKTDERGHVLFNPNLPLPKDMEDPIIAYRPTFHTKTDVDEQMALLINEDLHLFLNLRIIITAYGRVPSGAVDLSK